MPLIKNLIEGFILGDCLGVPFEFKKRNTFVITDMVGYGTHHKPKGTWSDDTSLVLATMDNFIKNGDFTSCIKNFSKFINNGTFTVDGVYDYGYGTVTAIRKFDNGSPALECGSDDISNNGNGSLMRMLPIGIYYHTYSDEEIIKQSILYSSLTHSHIISLICCSYYNLLIKRLLNKNEFKPSCKEVSEIIIKKFGFIKELHRILDLSIFNCKKDDIDSSGYVVSALEIILWVINKNNNYIDSVFEAINLGDDTDTNGALVGSIAGLLYENLPPDIYLNNIRNKDYLNNIIKNFIDCQKPLATIQS